MRRRPRGSTAFNADPQAPRLTQPLLPSSVASAAPGPSVAPAPRPPGSVAPAVYGPSVATESCITVATIAASQGAGGARATRAARVRAGTQARGTRRGTGLAPSIRRNYSQWEGVILDDLEPMAGRLPAARRTINRLSTGGETSTAPGGARGIGGGIASTSGRITKPVAAVATRQSTRVAATRLAAALAATDAGNGGNGAL